MASAALVLGLAAFAHGGQPHFKGTVKAIDDKSLTVDLGDGKEEKFLIDEDTKFEKGGAASSAKERQKASPSRL